MKICGEKRPMGRLHAAVTLPVQGSPHAESASLYAQRLCRTRTYREVVDSLSVSLLSSSLGLGAFCQLLPLQHSRDSGCSVSHRVLKRDRSIIAYWSCLFNCLIRQMVISSYLFFFVLGKGDEVADLLLLLLCLLERFQEG